MVFMSIKPLEFREIMGRFATGVTIMTTVDQGNPVGLTINSLTSVSLTPPTILFCLGKTRSVSSAFTKCEQFIVNILAQDQRDVSSYFSQSFSSNSIINKNFFENSEKGTLKGTLGYLVCKKENMIPVGDHFIIIGHVIEIVRGEEKDPLVFFRGQYV